MAAHRSSTRDVTHITLQVLVIGVLIVASFLIVRPFLLSLVLAAMVVAGTWPLMLKVETWLWGKRGLAVAAMTIAMLLLFILPFSFAVATIIENADGIVAWVRNLETQALPSPPDWVNNIPLLGPRLTAVWGKFTAGQGELSARLTPYIGSMLKWFLSQAGSFGMIFLQFLLMVILTPILYAKGEKVSLEITNFARRLSGNRGEEIAVLAMKIARGVALGVVGGALIQAFLGGIGLAVAGVPFTGVLTGVMFILTIAQIGPVPVLIPAVIWLYYNDQTAWAIALFVWTGFVGISDNILRPFLIGKGSDLPLLLIFAGVIGGLVAFGIIGLFIGPVILAVSYRSLAAWVKGSEVIPEAEEKG